MRYAKAIAAGIATAAGTIAQALDDNHLSTDEVGGICAAVAVAITVVWGIRNQSPVR